MPDTGGPWEDFATSQAAPVAEEKGPWSDFKPSEPAGGPWDDEKKRIADLAGNWSGYDPLNDDANDLDTRVAVIRARQGMDRPWSDVAEKTGQAIVGAAKGAKDFLTFIPRAGWQAAKTLASTAAAIPGVEGAAADAEKNARETLSAAQSGVMGLADTAKKAVGAAARLPRLMYGLGEAGKRFVKGEGFQMPKGHDLGGILKADSQFTDDEIRQRLTEMDATRKEREAVSRGDFAPSPYLGTGGMTSPERLAEKGSPVDPSQIEALSIGFDPTNYIPGIGLPGAAKVGGKALQVAGRAAQVPGRVAAAVSEHVPGIGIASHFVPKAKIARAVGSVAGRRAGEFVEQAGRELAGDTMAPTNRGIFASGAARILKGGAEGAASMAPFAVIQDRPEEAVGSLATGAFIGAGMGTLKNPLAGRFTEGDRTTGRAPVLSTEGFDYNTTPDLDAAHNTAAARMTEQARGEFNQIRHLMQGRAEIYVLPEADFNALVPEGVAPQGMYVEKPADGGKPRVYVREGVQNPIQTGWHEIGHDITRTMSDAERNRAVAALVRVNDMDAFTQRYLEMLYGEGQKGWAWNNLPETRAEAESLGLEPERSRQAIGEELLSEQTAALMRGQPIDSLATSRTGKRFLQQWIGRIAETFGYRMSNAEARSILGVNPSFTAAAIIEGALKGQAKQVGPAPSYGGEPTVAIRIAQLEPVAGRQITETTPLSERKTILDARRELKTLREDINPKTDFPAAGPAPVAPSKPSLPVEARPTGEQRKIAAFIRRSFSGIDPAAAEKIAREFQNLDADQMAILKRVAEYKMQARQEAASQPVEAPVGKTFTAPDGTKRTITGAVAEPAKPGDFIADDKGNVRRVAAVFPDGRLSVVFSSTQDTGNTIPVPAGRYTVVQHAETAQSNAPQPATTAPPPQSATQTGPSPRVDENPLTPAQPTASPARQKAGAPIIIPAHPGEAADILDLVAENGGVHIPPPAERKQEHDEFTRLPGVYAPLASVRGAVPIDQMAQIAYEAGLIPDNSPHTLAEEMSKSAASRSRIRKQQGAQNAEEKRAIRFYKDAESPTQKGEKITAETLNVGDEIELRGETIRVRSVDPDTGDVTLDDGDTYGRQVVESGQTIWAKKVKEAAPEPEDPWNIPDEAPAPKAQPAHTAESVRKLIEQAKAEATAKEKKLDTKAAQDRVKAAQVKAVLDAIGEPKTGLRRRVDEFGTETIAGDFDPANPLHRALAEIGGGISPEAVAVLENTQQAEGKARYIRYRSAKSNVEGTGGEGTADFGMKTRQTEYAADPAAERKSGTVQHKVIVPAGTEFTKGGRPMARFYTLDNLLHNADSAFEFADSKGIDTGYSKNPTEREAQLFQDAQHYAENHANGYTGEGKPIQQFPDSGLPKPNPDFSPHQIPENRFSFLNMLFHDESTTTSSRYAEKARQHAEATAKGEKMRKPAEPTPKARATELEAATLAQRNNRWIDPATGETNRMRDTFRKAGFDFGDKFKTPLETLSPDHILEISEAPLKLQQGDIPSVRPTGFTTDPAKLAAKGLPKSKGVRASFMPDPSKDIHIFRKTIKTKHGSRYYQISHNGDWFKVRLADHSNTSSEGGAMDQMFADLYKKESGSDMDIPHTLNVVLDKPVKSEKEANEIIKTVIRGIPEDALFRDVLYKGEPDQQVLGNDDIQVEWNNGNPTYDYPTQSGQSRRGVKASPKFMPSTIASELGVKYDGKIEVPGRDAHQYTDNTTGGTFVVNGDQTRESVGAKLKALRDRFGVKFMPEDTGKPGESEVPTENLAREAEAAGIHLSTDTVKGLMRNDEAVKAAVRKRIESATGRKARFTPSRSDAVKQAARKRLEARGRRFVPAGAVPVREEERAAPGAR